MTRRARRRSPSSPACSGSGARGRRTSFVPREPRLAHAREAEWNARRAVAMVEAKLDRATQGLIVADRSEAVLRELADSVPPHLRPPAAFALASLGSVLLGQARPHEAIGVLASATTLAPEHPAFDDVRWMLGQALLCAAAREWRSDFPVALRRGDPNWRETNRPAARGDRCHPSGGRGRAGPRAGPRAGARGAPVRRSHGHRRVTERMPRGLARGGQRAGGSHPVHPQADGGSWPRLSVRAARREGAAAVRGGGECLPARVGGRGGAPAPRGARGGSTVGRDLAGSDHEPLLLLRPARERKGPAALGAAGARSERRPLPAGVACRGRMRRSPQADLAHRRGTRGARAGAGRCSRAPRIFAKGRRRRSGTSRSKRNPAPRGASADETLRWQSS